MSKGNLIRRRARELDAVQSATGIRHEFSPAAASALLRAINEPQVDRGLIQAVARRSVEGATGKVISDGPTYADLIRATDEARRGRLKEGR